MNDPSVFLEYGIAGFAVSTSLLVARLFLKALDKRDEHINHLVDKHDSQQRYIADKSEASHNRLCDAIGELSKEIARKNN